MKSIASFKFYFVVLLFLDLQKLFSQEVFHYNLINNKVYCIYQDQKQNIWFGTEGGLINFKDRQSYFNDNSYLTGNRVNTLYQDRNNNLWVGTTKGLSIFLSFTENWQNITHTPYVFFPHHITIIFRDNYSNLWIGSHGDGILRYIGDFSNQIDTDIKSWQIYNTGTIRDPDILIDDISALSSDHWGNLWIGTENYGLYKFDCQQKWTKIKNFSENKIHIIFRDLTDTLWIGTSNGVFKTYDGSTWDSIITDREIFAIETDLLNRLWFGTKSQGLYRYDHGRLEAVSLGLLDGTQPCQAIFRDFDGNLWFATDGNGVYQLKLNWQVYKNGDAGLTANSITAVTIDRSNTLWFGTYLNSLFKFTNDRFYQVTIDNAIAGMNQINALLVDKSNNLWCATNKGAHCYLEQKSWNHYLKDAVVTALVQDYQHHIWFGTTKGLFRLEGKETVVPIAEDRLPSKNIFYLFEDADQNIWVGSDSGIVVLKNKVIISSYRVADGLASDKIRTIVQDKNREFWVGTPKGLSHLNQQNRWETCQNNDIKCLWVDNNNQLWIGSTHNFDRFDGLSWWNYNTFIPGAPTIRGIVQDETENFWLASDGGIIHYMPSDRQPPDTQFIDTPPKILGVGSHTFFYEGHDPDTPSDKLVYSCQLMYHPQVATPVQWQNYSPQKYFTCNSLANGTYLLSIKARDSAGNEEPSPLEHKFVVDVTPPTTIILEPVKDDFVTGEVPIIGAAFDDTSYNDFKRYWFEYGRGNNLKDIKHWEIQAGSDKSVFDNILVIWQPDSLGDYYIKLCAADSLGHQSSFAVHVTVVEMLKKISPTSGGMIQLLNQKIQLYIPPGAVDETVEIYASPEDTSKSFRPISGNIRLSALAFKLGPDIPKFRKPATLTIHYDESDISNLDEAKLAIFAEAEKKTIGGLIKPQLNRIQTTIDTLGRFWLVECEEDEPSDSLRAKSAVSMKIECQPRIFSPRGTGFAVTTTISFNLTEETEVTIKIYNLAGRLVQTLLDHELLRPGKKALEWNGRDSHGELCPSDLYIVTYQSPHAHITKTVMILDKSDH